MGIKPHKGILLYGPPGCGKTMIAKAIANEINAHFIAIKGPELLNKYLGESEANLRKVFLDAREKQPAIIFFDEIDAVAQKRSSNESLRSESRFVTQLLSLMDGIEDYGKVCVIASTNRHEFLDDALLRPGRFDYNIYIDKPTKKGCRDIFCIKTRDMPISSELNE
jgi:SpoVK/Ycf46/Vps4 family AAA+-type ATPase